MKLTISVWSRVNDFVKETSLQEMTAWQRWHTCGRKKPYDSKGDGDLGKSHQIAFAIDVAPG
jgi:hypothetical protein